MKPQRLRRARSHRRLGGNCLTTCYLFSPSGEFRGCGQPRNPRRREDLVCFEGKCQGTNCCKGTLIFNHGNGKCEEAWPIQLPTTINQAPKITTTTTRWPVTTTTSTTTTRTLPPTPTRACNDYLWWPCDPTKRDTECTSSTLQRKVEVRGTSNTGHCVLLSR